MEEGGEKEKGKMEGKEGSIERRKEKGEEKERREEGGGNREKGKREINIYLIYIEK